MHHEEGPNCPLCEFKLGQAHPFFRVWYPKIKAKYINVHIAWSFRNEEEQTKAYAEHRSNVQWPKSAHNQTQDGKPCSWALDVFQIDEDGVARFSPMFYIKLNQENIADREPLMWGGNFRKLADRDHFEIDFSKIKPGPQAA